jgi:glycosyltransferase involved in cell wall biosynthesis
MKKLIILEDSSKVTFGGGQKGTIELIETLKNEYEIILFDCTKDSIFQEKIKKYNLKQFYLKCQGKIIGGNNSSFSIGCKELLFYPFLTIFNLYKLFKFIKQLRIQNKKFIFYTSNKKHLLLLYILNKLSKIEYIYHARTYDDKNSIFYKIMIPALKNAKKIFCVSDFIKKNINYNNCVTVYNPLHIDKYYLQYHKPKLLKKKVVIATASELLKWKGIDYFIKSYEFLSDDILKQYDIKYFMYGKGKEEENLKKLSSSNSRIIFKGFNSNLYKEYQENIDIIVIPSISPEAFGRTTIEGSFFGVVPLSSNIGAQKELLSQIDKNLLFENKNPKDIAKKIEYAILNYNLLSKKSIKFSEQFEFSKFQNLIKALFKELL